MSVETKSTHITKAGGNVFADLGFEPAEAAALQAETKRVISEKLAIKESLMTELAEWIDENKLKQADAAQILGVTRPRVSDVINGKAIRTCGVLVAGIGSPCCRAGLPWHETQDTGSGAHRTSLWRLCRNLFQEYFG